MRVAERLSQAGNEADAQAVEDKLVGYADEVKAGRIVQSKTE